MTKELELRISMGLPALEYYVSQLEGNIKLLEMEVADRTERLTIVEKNLEVVEILEPQVKAEVEAINKEIESINRSIRMVDYIRPIAYVKSTLPYGKNIKSNPANSIEEVREMVAYSQNHHNSSITDVYLKIGTIGQELAEAKAIIAGAYARAAKR